MKKAGKLLPFLLVLTIVFSLSVTALAAETYTITVDGSGTVANHTFEAYQIFSGDLHAPTANEGIATSEVKVIAGEGNVTIAGAAGKKVVISNILGQVVANTVISSDNAVIAAPAGVVVVAVEGEAAVKAIVK